MDELQAVRTIDDEVYDEYHEWKEGLVFEYSKKNKTGSQQLSEARAFFIIKSFPFAHSGFPNKVGNFPTVLFSCRNDVQPCSNNFLAVISIMLDS